MGRWGSSAGKGTARRPSAATDKEYTDSYCRSFGHQPSPAGTCRNCGKEIEKEGNPK